MTGAELEDRVGAGWRPFRTEVAALPEDAFDMVTSSGWTIREMLAHVAFWEETVAPFVEGMLRGRDWPDQAEWHGGGGFDGTDGWPHADVHNAREAAWARTHSVAEVLARWDRAHARCLAAVGGLSDAELADARFIDEVKMQTYGHYPEHLAEMRAAASGNG
ncbi:MAG TPA: DinB family protein [Candidatus Dormibacteraeota bacterium]|nr:DinB family protein [Candidatus Dormibacteraeota bacterium]